MCSSDLAAVGALGRLKDPAAAPALTKALEDPDPNVRWAAVGALGRLKDPAAAPALTKALEDPDENVRKAARRVLDGLGVAD